MPPTSSPYPGARHPSNEIRLAPDGRVAQRLPEEMCGKDRQLGITRNWLSFAWPDFRLEVSAYTDDEVADWRVLHREGVGESGKAVDATPAPAVEQAGTSDQLDKPRRLG